MVQPLTDIQVQLRGQELDGNANLYLAPRGGGL